MRVPVTIDEVELEGDFAPVDGVCATCNRCDHQVEIFGTSDASRRRALATMRDECPENESNYHFDEDDE